MANLKEVKGRIQSVTSTQQITKAMKMVAAAKLRKSAGSDHADASLCREVGWRHAERFECRRYAVRR